MVREIRDMALEEVTKDIDAVARAVAAPGNSARQLKNNFTSFVGSGLSTLAPALTLVIDLLKKRK